MAETSCGSRVVASGARNNYFGHDEWTESAPGLKTIDDAIDIRRRVLLALEEAEQTTDPARRAQVKVCDNHDCDWLFLDDSPSSRRRSGG